MDTGKKAFVIVTDGLEVDQICGDIYEAEREAKDLKESFDCKVSIYAVPKHLADFIVDALENRADTMSRITKNMVASAVVTANECYHMFKRIEG